MNVRWRAIAACAMVAVAAGCGGGDDDAATGTPNLRWYVFDEPSGAYDDAIANCNKSANGRYTVELVGLPTTADLQRELMVRRLAAEDRDIDILGMDVPWTAEFAEAGWIAEWTGEDRQEVSEGTLEGPLASGTYKDKLYAVPFSSNAQFLSYRTHREPEPPKTWDEMIEMAEKLGPKTGKILVQGAQYEGLTVWFNTLINSAGGVVVDDEGNIGLGEAGVQAAQVMQKLAKSSAADPNLPNATEDPTRLAFQGGDATFMLNWPYVYPSAKADAPEIYKNMGVARYPSVDPNEPSHVTIGGINLAVSSYSRNRDLAFEATKCLRGPENQLINAQKGGLPPTTEALYDDPKIKEAYPGFSDLVRDTIKDGVPRPVTPAYSDVSLAIQRSLHPPSAIDPQKSIENLRDKVKTVSEGGLY